MYIIFPREAKYRGKVSKSYRIMQNCMGLSRGHSREGRYRKTERLKILRKADSNVDSCKYYLGKIFLRKAGALFLLSMKVL